MNEEWFDECVPDDGFFDPLVRQRAWFDELLSEQDRESYGLFSPVYEQVFDSIF